VNGALALLIVLGMLGVPAVAAATIEGEAGPWPRCSVVTYYPDPDPDLFDPLNLVHYNVDPGCVWPPFGGQFP
jgi:hypothetical protein